MGTAVRQTSRRQSLLCLFLTSISIITMQKALLLVLLVALVASTSAWYGAGFGMGISPYAYSMPGWYGGYGGYPYGGYGGYGYGYGYPMLGGWGMMGRGY